MDKEGVYIWPEQHFDAGDPSDTHEWQVEQQPRGDQQSATDWAAPQRLDASSSLFFRIYEAFQMEVNLYW